MNYIGTTSGRFIKSIALAGGNREAAAAFAQSQNWSDGGLIAKAAVGGVESSGSGGVANIAEVDFLALAWPLSLIGQMTHVSRTTFTRGSLRQSGRAVAHFVRQGAGAPMSLQAFQRLVPMAAKKVQALCVASMEAVAEGAEEELSADLAKAAALVLDQVLVDGVAASDSRPASILLGATPITGTGDVAADVAAALAAFSGDLRTACWLLNPTTAAAAGLQVLGGGTANDLGALGGRLAGLPAFCSEAVPVGSAALVDQAAVQLAGGDRAEFRTSQGGVIEMLDNPTGATVDPAAATSLVSMFQADAIALGVVLPVDWRVVRTGAVVIVTGFAED